MSTEQPDQVPPSQQPQSEWGATPPQPAAPRQKWSMKRTVIAVVVAVGIAGAGGVAIYAASGSVAAEQQGRGPNGGGGPMIIGGPQGGFDETQHGEFQVGEVTEVSDTSITAKSEDGYTRTYVVDEDTVIEDVEKGDSVTIVATVSGDTSTAESVMERGAGMQPRRDGTNGGPQQQGGPQDDGDDGN